MVCIYHIYGASLVAQTVKCLPAMWETRVRSLGQEDALEKEMATHSSILVWRIPWMEEPGRLVHGVRKSRTRLSDLTFFSRYHMYMCVHSVMSDSVRPHELYVACQTPLWGFPGKNTGVGCHVLLHGDLPQPRG